MRKLGNRNILSHRRSYLSISQHDKFSQPCRSHCLIRPSIWPTIGNFKFEYKEHYNFVIFQTQYQPCLLSWHQNIRVRAITLFSNSQFLLSHVLSITGQNYSVQDPGCLVIIKLINYNSNCKFVRTQNECH